METHSSTEVWKLGLKKKTAVRERRQGQARSPRLIRQDSRNRERKGSGKGGERAGVERKGACQA